MEYTVNPRQSESDKSAKFRVPKITFSAESDVRWGGTSWVTKGGAKPIAVDGRNDTKNMPSNSLARLRNCPHIGGKMPSFVCYILLCSAPPRIVQEN